MVHAGDDVLTLPGYLVVIPVLCIIGSWAIYTAYKIHVSSSVPLTTVSTDEVNAPQSEPPSTFSLGWSFFAATAGSWIFFSPATLAARVGYLGAIAYPLGVSVPLIIMAYIGPAIQRRFPAAKSVGEFLELRFSPFRLITEQRREDSQDNAENNDKDHNDHTNSFIKEKERATQTVSPPSYTIVFYYLLLGVLFLAMLGSLFLGLTSEYTSLGDIVSLFLGIRREAIIAIAGCITIVYTTLGGFAISMRTDQIQGYLSLTLLLTIVVLSFWAYFGSSTDELTRSVGGFFMIATTPLSEHIFDTHDGWNSIIILPTSVSAATLMNEIVWQRVGGAASPSSMKKAALGSALIVAIMACLFSLIGYFSALEETPLSQTNLSLFSLLDVFGTKKEQKVASLGSMQGPGVPAAIWIIIAAVVATLSQCSLDSSQNALTSLFRTSFVTKTLYTKFAARKSLSNDVPDSIPTTSSLGVESEVTPIQDSNLSLNADGNAANQYVAPVFESQRQHIIEYDEENNSSMPLPRDEKPGLVSPPSSLLRICVFLINAAAMATSLCKLNVVSLFLTSNIIALSFAPVILLGVFSPFKHLYTVAWAFFSPIVGFIALFTYGYFAVEGSFDSFFDRVLKGIQFSMYDNYSWKPYCTMLGASCGTSLFGIAINYVVRKISAPKQCL